MPGRESAATGSEHDDARSTCSSASHATAKSATLPYSQQQQNVRHNSADNETTRAGKPKVPEAAIALPGIEAGFAQLGQYLMAGKNGGDKIPTMRVLTSVSLSAREDWNDERQLYLQ